MFNKLAKTYLGSTIPVINVYGAITPKTYFANHTVPNKLSSDFKR